MTIAKHWTDAYVDDLLSRATLMRTYGDERGATIAERQFADLRTRGLRLRSQVASRNALNDNNICEHEFLEPYRP